MKAASISALLLVGLLIPRDALPDTQLGEVNEYYSRTYSWSATLRYVATVAGMDSLQLHCPYPWSMTMQNFSQTAGRTVSTTPPADSLWTDSYKVRALWAPPDTVSGTYELRVDVWGTSTVTFPSWDPENPWWYPDTDPWVTGTSSAPVNSITQAAATEVFSYNGIGVDRERDLEGIGSWLQGLVYDDSPGLDQTGDAVISRGSGNSGGFANALDSIASTMGIPAGHMSTISFPGTFNLGCADVSLNPNLHGNAVGWDGPDQLWILIEPQWSGTATGPAIAALSYHPEADSVRPLSVINSTATIVADFIIENLVHSGASASNCAGWRDACGRAGCGGTIVGKKYNGLIPTLVPVTRSKGSFQLLPPRPNPLRGTTEVHFVLGNPAQVALAIYDVRGACVNTIARGLRGSGPHRLVWDGRDESGRPVASGVYFVNLQVDGQSARKKLVVVR